MLDTDVAPGDSAGLVQRQVAIAGMAAAHATLAAAAVLGLTAHLDPLGTEAWRDVASTDITG